MREQPAWQAVAAVGQSKVRLRSSEDVAQGLEKRRIRYQLVIDANIQLCEMLDNPKQAFSDLEALQKENDLTPQQVFDGLLKYKRKESSEDELRKASDWLYKVSTETKEDEQLSMSTLRQRRDSAQKAAAEMLTEPLPEDIKELETLEDQILQVQQQRNDIWLVKDAGPEKVQQAKILDEECEKLVQSYERAADEMLKKCLKPDFKKEQLDSLLQTIESCNSQIYEAQIVLNDLGFSPRAKGSEYKDEELKFGWRARSAADANTDFVTTDYHSPEMQKLTQASFDQETGTFRGLYIEWYSGMWKTNDVLLTTTSRRKIPDEYAIGLDGELHRFRGHQVPNSQRRKKTIHHTSVVAGDDVIGAGDIRFESGRIVAIGNASGHYKPQPQHVTQTLEFLLKKGALFDTQWMMINPDTGKGEPLTGQAKEVYKAITDIQRGLYKKLAAQTSIEGDLEKIKRGKEALNRLGAGPVNKIRPVTVETIEADSGLAGGAFRVTEKRISTAKEFLMTGGNFENKEKSFAKGKKQSEVKQEVLNELLEKTKSTREELDHVAEEANKELPEKLQQLARKLEHWATHLEKLALEDPRKGVIASRLREQAKKAELTADPKRRQRQLEDALEEVRKHLASG